MKILLAIVLLFCELVLYFMSFATVFTEEKSALYNFGVPALVTFAYNFLAISIHYLL